MRLTAREAAAQLGIRIKYVYHLARHGKLQAIRSGGSVFFMPEEIERIRALRAGFRSAAAFADAEDDTAEVIFDELLAHCTALAILCPGSGAPIPRRLVSHGTALCVRCRRLARVWEVP